MNTRRIGAVAALLLAVALAGCQSPEQTYLIQQHAYNEAQRTLLQLDDQGALEPDQFVAASDGLDVADAALEKSLELLLTGAPTETVQAHLQRAMAGLTAAATKMPGYTLPENPQ